MKGLLILLLTLFIFSLTGCNQPFEKESSELQFSVEVDYENLCFVMEYDFGKEYKKFVETGFIYAKNYEGTDKLTFESDDVMFRLIDIAKEDKKCSIIMSSSKNVITNYTFRGYIKKSNGSIIYSEMQKTVEVKENIVIMQADIAFDTKKYVVTRQDPYYSIKIENTSDFKEIVLTLTPNEGLYFMNGIEIFINDKLIPFEKINLNDGIITISLDDPNWSPIF